MMDAGWVLVRNADARRLRTSVIVSAIIWTCALPFFALFRMQSPALETPSMNPVYVELAPYPEELPEETPEPIAKTLPETVPLTQPAPLVVPPVEAKPVPEVAEVSDIDQRATQPARAPAVAPKQATPAPATREAPSPAFREMPTPTIRESSAPAVRELAPPAVASVPVETAPIAAKPAAAVPSAKAPVEVAKSVAVEEPVPIPTTRIPAPTAPAPPKTRTPSKYQTQTPAAELSEQFSADKFSSPDTAEAAASVQATGSAAASQPRGAVLSGQRVADATDRKVDQLGKNLASPAIGTTNKDSQSTIGSPSSTKAASGTPFPSGNIAPGSGNLSGDFDFGGANARQFLGSKKVTIPPKDLREEPEDLSTLVSFVIEPGGTVFSSTIRFEPPLSPAIEAILRMAFSNWQFSPAESDGRVEFRYSIKVR